MKTLTRICKKREVKNVPFAVNARKSCFEQGEKDLFSAVSREAIISSLL